MIQRLLVVFLRQVRLSEVSIRLDQNEHVLSVDVYLDLTERQLLNSNLNDLLALYFVDIFFQLVDLVVELATYLLINLFIGRLVLFVVLVVLHELVHYYVRLKAITVRWRQAPITYFKI